MTFIIICLTKKVKKERERENKTHKKIIINFIYIDKMKNNYYKSILMISSNIIKAAFILRMQTIVEKAMQEKKNRKQK